MDSWTSGGQGLEGHADSWTIRQADSWTSGGQADRWINGQVVNRLGRTGRFRDK